MEKFLFGNMMIGMKVDANTIRFKRLKERAGKSGEWSEADKNDKTFDLEFEFNSINSLSTVICHLIKVRDNMIFSVGVDKGSETDKMRMYQEFMNCFPYFNIFINRFQEMIVEPDNNVYFSLKGVECKDDMCNKVISALSRPAYKGLTKKISTKILAGLNLYLGTSFSVKEIEEIYTYFGNGANEEWRKKFVSSGYNLKVIEDLKASRDTKKDERPLDKN